MVWFDLLRDFGPPLVTALLGYFLGVRLKERELRHLEESKPRAELKANIGRTAPIFSIEPKRRHEITIMFGDVDISSAGNILFSLRNTGNTDIKHLRAYFIAGVDREIEEDIILYYQHLPVRGMEDTAFLERVGRNKIEVQVELLKCEEEMVFEVFLNGLFLDFQFALVCRPPDVTVSGDNGVSIERPYLPSTMTVD